MKRKHSKRKVMAMILAVVMIITMLPTMAYADTTIHRPDNWDKVQTTINGMKEGDVLDLTGVSRNMGADYDTLTVGKSITIKGGNTTGRNATDVWYGAYNLRIEISNGANVTLQNLYLSHTEYPTDPNPGKSFVSGQGNLTINECFLGYSSLYSGNEQKSYKPEPIVDMEGDVTINGKPTVQAPNNTTEIIGGYLDASMTSDASGAAGIAVRATGKVTVNGGEISGGQCNSASYPGGAAIVAAKVEINGGKDSVAANKYSTCIFGGNGGTAGGDSIIADETVTINGGYLLAGSGTNGAGGDAIASKGDINIKGMPGATDNIKIQSGAGSEFHSPGSVVVLQPVDGDISRTVTIDNATMYTRAVPTNGTASVPFVMQENDKAIINGSDVGWSSSDPLFSAGWFKITNPVYTRGNFVNAKSIAINEAKTAAEKVDRTLYTDESLKILDEAIALIPADFSDTTIYKSNSGVTAINKLAADVNAAIDGLVKKQQDSSGGGYYPPTTPNITIKENVGGKVTLGSDNTTLTITPDKGYQIKDVLVNGVSKGTAATLTGLKATDKIEVIFEKIPEKTPEQIEAEQIAKITSGVKNTSITSAKATASKGKIKLTWNKSKGYKVDGYVVYRTTGNKAFKKMISKKANYYVNTKSLRKGTTYKFKIVGFRIVDGKIVYTKAETIEVKAK